MFILTNKNTVILLQTVDILYIIQLNCHFVLLNRFSLTFCLLACCLSDVSIGFKSFSVDTDAAVADASSNVCHINQEICCSVGESHQILCILLIYY